MISLGWLRIQREAVAGRPWQGGRGSEAVAGRPWQ
jgi:hypothetical protein